MYKIQDVYDAFELAGQPTVSLDVENINQITEQEIINSCVEADPIQVIQHLADIANSKPLEELKAHRDSLISKTDWVVTKSLESGNEIPSEWLIYRQALRDITDQYTSLDTVVWPVKPE